MKSTIFILLLLPTFFLCPSLTAQNSIYEQNILIADAAAFLVGNTQSGTWQPTHSFRVGYERRLMYPLAVQVFGDYCAFDFANHEGLTMQDYSYGHRRDYSIGIGVIVVNFFEYALGYSYSSQDEVVHHTMTPNQVTVDPAVKKGGLYMHFALGGSIHIAGPVRWSLGLMWRNAFNGRGGLGARTGMRIAF